MSTCKYNHKKKQKNKKKPKCTPQLSLSLPARLDKDKNHFPLIQYLTGTGCHSPVMHHSVQTFKAAASSIKY
jgi:hypothetical protein